MLTACAHWSRPRLTRQRRHGASFQPTATDLKVVPRSAAVAPGYRPLAITRSSQLP